MNALELETLRRLDFRLFVSPELFESTCARLEERLQAYSSELGSDGGACRTAGGEAAERPGFAAGDRAAEVRQ